MKNTITAQMPISSLLTKAKFKPKTKAMLRCPTCHCQKVLPTGRTSYAEIGEWDAMHQCYEETKELTEHACTACEERFYI
jgi:hypothetical protein